ncbi:MAG: hypothetical protein RLY20_813 [Verrucomicrobiota bacterium]
MLLAGAAAFLSFCGIAPAAPVSFTGSYAENFDSLGTAGTTMPVGFRSLGIPGGNSTYTAAAPISAAGIAGATNNPTSLGLWTPGNAGYAAASRLANAGWWGNTADRALASGPTGNGATVTELGMTNNTGGDLLGVVFSYTLKAMTNGSAGTEAGELPGYAFFYSTTGGTNASDWTKVNTLSLTNSTQATTNNSGNVGITFASAVPSGGVFYFRWADDNNVASSPDQTFAVDNINVTAVSVGITSPAAATYVQPGQLDFSAVASAPGSSVTNVEFFVDGTKIGEDNLEPYSVSWLSPSIGSHSLTVVATDANGETNISSAVGVTIIAAPVTAITRGPYLQLSTPTGITIRWRTDLATDSRVAFGAATNALTSTNYSALAVTEHEVALTGLTPDSQYFYAIGSTAGANVGPSANHYFLTHPSPSTPKPIRVWVIGDAGTGTANQTAVRDAFYNYNGTNLVHAWLQLGDNAYNSGLDSEFQANMFNIYGNILRNTVTWPTLGNHETAQSTVFTDSYAHFQIFTLPTAGEAGGVASGTEHYYSFDLGMVHFICLDSMTASRATNGAMANWLRSDLLANTNRWLIAYWHHPPYTKGSHDSDTETELIEMRQNFNPILEAGGVDLILSGHSHCYERSFCINGHYGLSSTFTNTMIALPGSGREINGTNAYLKPENFTGAPIGNRGAVYSVVGSSGQASGGALNHPAMFISLNNLGSMVLDITSNRLDAVFLRETGASNDWFTIRKENFPPVATNKTFTVAADVSTNLVLTGSDVNRNPLTFAAATLPTNGLLSGFDTTNGTFSYTPAHGAMSGDVFTFVANDGRTNSALAQITINIASPIDANSNGIPDAWETQYSITDANADDDGDGASNLQEYRAGTNPTNSLSWLHFTQIGSAGAGYQVVWSSVGGTRYRIQFSDGDASGSFTGAFTSVLRAATDEMDSNPAGTAGTMGFTDDFTLTGGAPSSGTRYYRVEAVR